MISCEDTRQVLDMKKNVISESVSSEQGTTMRHQGNKVGRGGGGVVERTGLIPGMKDSMSSGESCLNFIPEHEQ